MQKIANKIEFFRQWIRLLLRAEKWLDCIGILLLMMFFIHYLPMDVLNDLPATGGDTGSHFWPLWTLVHKALPHWQVRVLNPGNLAGEPHLTHYFPLPFLLMALLSKLMPLGMAFNIGSILPIGLLPVCIYICLRGLGLRFPTPLLAAFASLSFVYNESFSMWGGNTLSTMAGQFAHVYAFDFFFLGVGALAYELRRRKTIPIYSSLCFAAVFLSHFYVALVLPIVYLIYLFFYRRFGFLFFSGLMALLMSVWFVIPMLQNSRWTTAFGLKWGGEQLMHEIFPLVLQPFLFTAIVLLAVVLILHWYKKIIWNQSEKMTAAILLSIIAFSLIFYPLFPDLGLVDVRMVPQAQLAVCLLAAFLFSKIIQTKLPKPVVYGVCLLISMILIYWPTRQIRNYPSWAKWNYSGWQNKSAYPDLQKLSQALHVENGFSAPRVVYENNDLSNAAGTVRVFEMLPYFAQRSTLESVYMQATVVAPAAFYLQSLISLTPSCPFPNYSCTSLSIPKAMDYFRLLGVSDLILITAKAKEMAAVTAGLQHVGDYGFWSLYHVEDPPSLVQVVKKSPTTIDSKNFKTEFYKWLGEYNTDSSLQVVDFKNQQTSNLVAADGFDVNQCHPQLQVDFSELKLHTDCPGRLHMIKFAYHPTWKSNHHESIYLLSPGFMGIKPEQADTVLHWGDHWLWSLSNGISWSAFVFLIFIAIRNFIDKKRGVHE